MLPEQLSTDTSSLLETGDKLSIVIEFVVGNDGSVHSSSIYRANGAKASLASRSGMAAHARAAPP